MNLDFNLEMDEVIIYIPMKYIGVCNVMVSSIGKRNVYT